MSYLECCRLLAPGAFPFMNGLLIVDKPAGMTSHDVVARVRKLTGESSVGHLGTLDPMATGVLPLLLGRFTRLAQFFQKDSKRYIGAIRFGFATDTYDAEGQPLADSGEASRQIPQTLDEIRGMAREFCGRIEQTPPPFSAKKLDGKPAYKLARQGKTVELRPVWIDVRRFDILSYQSPLAAFEVEVSAGGYIRSLAHDLGKRAGGGAHLASLCRVQAGGFTLRDALTLEQIDAWMRDGTLVERLPHPRQLLPDMPSVTADEMTAARLRNGNMCNLPEYSRHPLIKIFSSQRDLLAVGRRVAGTLIQPMVVLG